MRFELQPRTNPRRERLTRSFHPSKQSSDRVTSEKRQPLRRPLGTGCRWCSQGCQFDLGLVLVPTQDYRSSPRASKLSVLYSCYHPNHVIKEGFFVFPIFKLTPITLMPV